MEYEYDEYIENVENIEENMLTQEDIEEEKFDTLFMEMTTYCQKEGLPFFTEYDSYSTFKNNQQPL